MASNRIAFVIASLMLAATAGAIALRPTTKLADLKTVSLAFTVGDRAVEGKLQKRLVELRFGLTGRIPDGMLFRVSSIDTDPVRAFGQQEQFVQKLLEAVGPAERKRLSGLGESPSQL